MRNDNFITYSHNQTDKETNYLWELSSVNTVKITQIRHNLTMLSECDVEISQTSAHFIDQLSMS